MTVVEHEYRYGRIRMIGELHLPSTTEEANQGVIVVPAFGGVGSIERSLAQKLAVRGAKVLIADYYGDGRTAKTEDEAWEMMNAINGDRKDLAGRVRMAVQSLQQNHGIHADHTAAVGFCFGGKAALDLVRSGSKLRAVASVHGVYDPPGFALKRFEGSVMVLHGWRDGLCPPSDFLRLAEELNVIGCDWRSLVFGNAGHAFTNERAGEFNDGFGYDEVAAQLTWSALDSFLYETIGLPQPLAPDRTDARAT